MTPTCQDFNVTHTRWGADGSPYQRRMTEHTDYCPHHYVGFTGYHIGYVEREGKEERLFECSYCGCQFAQSQGMDCDTR